ncbi:hypothetical protein [Mitsuokella sp.]|jgi:hypothetical protein
MPSAQGRKFHTTDSRNQGRTLKYYGLKDAFSLATIAEIAGEPQLRVG